MLDSLLLLICEVQVTLNSEVQSFAFVEIDFDLGITMNNLGFSVRFIKFLF